EDAREGAPICRWTIDDVTVDVMPAPLDLPGFSNRWYPIAITLADVHELGDDVRIRVPIVPVLLATKLEAVASGTRGDLRESRDVEDIVSLVDGRESLANEAHNAPADLRAYLAARLGALLDLPGFPEVVAGHLPGDSVSQERVPVVLDRLRRIAGR
ncbi:MAG: hypothetical protein HY905_28195, partial [Deltaproteobacteria bacterium]|nr:hypothetical protein [Deltaproteobacteria bacterium]